MLQPSDVFSNIFEIKVILRTFFVFKQKIENLIVPALVFSNFPHTF